MRDSIDLPQGWGTDGLRVHLRKSLTGQNPGDLPEQATLEQLAAVLAAAPDGAVGSRQAVQGAERWLWGQHRDGCLPFTPIEHQGTAPARPIPLLFTIKAGGQSPQEAANAKRAALSAQMRGDIPHGPHPAAVQPATTTTYLVYLADFAKLRRSIELAGFKSDLIDLLTGGFNTPKDRPEHSHLPAAPTANSTVGAVAVPDRASEIRESYSHLDLTVDRELTIDELGLVIVGVGRLWRDGTPSEVKSVVQKNSKGFDYTTAHREWKGKKRLYSLETVVKGLIKDRYASGYVAPELQLASSCDTGTRHG